MFPHLLTWNPPNLVEMKQKQNKVQIFIANPLSYKNFMKNALTIFFFVGGCVPLGVDREVQ